MSNLMTEPPYLETLRQQEQADMDGTMVRVSRQAVDEAIADIERLRAALSTAREVALREAIALAENWTIAAHTAYDIRKGTFPKMSPVEEALADAILALIPQPMEKVKG